MSNLLRRPAAVPCLFSPGIEGDEAPSRPPLMPSRPRGGRSGSALLSMLVFMAELPLLKGAAVLLSLSLAH